MFHHDILSQDQIKQFRLLYSRRTNRELALYFKCTPSEIEDLAHRLALGKCKHTFKGLAMRRWTKEESDRLTELYPDMSNLDIARRLGRSEKAVVSRACKLGLQKSMDRRIAMGFENLGMRKDRQ
jgi:hypothetical protein